MYKLEQMKSMFNCNICSKLLVDPVTMPCGDTVCKLHLKDYISKMKFECECCKQEHSVPNEGFVISRFIQNMLEIEINPIYEEFKNEIRLAYKTVDETDKVAQESISYISDYFDGIIRQVDLRREQLKEEIDTYSDKTIKSIKEIQSNYIKLSKEKTDIKINIENSKKDLDELINKFDKIDQKQFEHIKDNVASLRQKFERSLDEFKSSLIGHKGYSFTYREKTIEDIFGIFSENLVSNMIIPLYELNALCEFPTNQKWELLYRATRNGFATADFHRECDNKGNTLTIIKLTNGNIFGGYIDIAWMSDGEYHSDPNAFLFSLVNKDDKPFKAKVSRNGQNAILCHSSYGPTFGIDICISSNSNTNSSSYSNIGHTYKHPDYQCGSTEAKSILAGSFNFQTVEIEVFVKI